MFVCTLRFASIRLWSPPNIFVKSLSVIFLSFSSVRWPWDQRTQDQADRREDFASSPFLLPFPLPLQFPIPFPQRRPPIPRRREEEGEQPFPFPLPQRRKAQGHLPLPFPQRRRQEEEGGQVPLPFPQRRRQEGEGGEQVPLPLRQSGKDERRWTIQIQEQQVQVW